MTEALEQETRDCAFTLDEDNAGLVWCSGKPMWCARLALDMRSPRSLCAREARLHAGIWFAVKGGAAVHGVMELAGALEPESAQKLRAIERIRVRLGLDSRRRIGGSRNPPCALMMFWVAAYERERANEASAQRMRSKVSFR